MISDRRLNFTDCDYPFTWIKSCLRCLVDRENRALESVINDDVLLLAAIPDLAGDAAIEAELDALLRPRLGLVSRQKRRT